MHNCTGNSEKVRDLTSLDCPVCGTSVLFDRGGPDGENGDDVNAVWEKHYFNGCTQKAVKAAPQEICAKQGCRVVLKVTNRSTCSGCKVTFCLAHRLPEDHGCAPFTKEVTRSTAQATAKYSNARLEGLDRLEGLARSDNGRKDGALQCPLCGDKDWLSVTQLEKHVATCTGSAPGDLASSIAGTAVSVPVLAPRVEVANAKAQLCPMCDQRFFTAAEVVDHFEKSHSEISQARTDAGTGLLITATEQCPMCSQLFATAAEVAAHFESSHA